MSHNIYLDKESIPGDARVLGIWVRIPRILFATEDGILDEYTIGDLKLVYIHLTDEEWNSAQGNQAAINTLGQTLGPEIAAALGGYVKSWSAPPSAAKSASI